MNKTDLTQKIKRRAQELGFDLVGVAPVEPFPELAFYKEWIEAGYAGKMEYMTRDVERRTDVTRVVPEAKSVIVCAMNYHTDYPLSIEMNDPARGWISRYAWGDDYHEVLQNRLKQLLDYIRTECPEDVIAKIYVDTGPVVDRVYAKYAGIGWFGKNTCILNQELGSWFFLGEIIINLELDYDYPAPDRCGSCNLCLEACPTEALLEPYILDARRCISYLTIELRDEIPIPLRDHMGHHIFGCDICQDVCPWNRKAPVTQEPSFQPREGLFHPDLEAMASMTLEEFRQTFRKNPVKRAKYRGFLRNVAVAMGNSGEPKFLPILKILSQDEDELVASHARWAMEKIKNTTHKQAKISVQETIEVES